MEEAGWYDEKTNGVVTMADRDTQRGQVQSAVYRILDANLDRAREGLRIVEEWCRFGLNNAQLSGECKQLRQELASWHTAEIRAARDTPGDPGTELTHPQEEQNDRQNNIQHRVRRRKQPGRMLHL